MYLNYIIFQLFHRKLIPHLFNLVLVATWWREHTDVLEGLFYRRGSNMFGMWLQVTCISHSWSDRLQLLFVPMLVKSHSTSLPCHLMNTSLLVLILFYFHIAFNVIFFNTTVLVLWDSLAGKVLCHASLITWIQVPLNYVKVEDDVWLHKIVLWLPYNHSGTCAQPHTSCTYIDIIIITKNIFYIKFLVLPCFFMNGISEQLYTIGFGFNLLHFYKPKPILE